MENNLPNPPWRVWAKTSVPKFRWVEYHAAAWFVYGGNDNWPLFTARFPGGVMEERADLLTVIDHPRNDPEALEIIRKAKEQK